MSTSNAARGIPRALTVAHLVQPVEGGVARVVTDLVRAQTEAGLRAVVLCPSGGPLTRAAEAAGAETRLWLAGRKPGADLPWEVFCAARLLRRLRPDVVHLHSAKAGLAGRLAVRGRVPTVHQPHAWSFQAVGGPTAAWARRWERHAARWTARLLCVSEAERETGLRAGIDGRYAVVPNGIETDRYPHAGGVARRQARAALSAVHALPQRVPLVVCVGRLTRQKGQDLLLRAWPEVAARVPGARLALIGDGPERDALRRAAGPGVLVAGHSDDVLPWYVAADVVVQPSRWEGMALAPLEAMAVGRPVVVTDVGGARECLPDGHQARCLVPPEDPGALAGALAALLGDAHLRRVLGDEAAAHVRAAHDVRRTAAACVRLYRELTTVVPPRAPEAKEYTRR
ncbi:glycosyltransferase [Streptomyces avicenniae]|uniref:glycosyltransferase n=1 Tax=Streptomyces avicenniae TaxID=500153 RepID=UPI000AD8D06C|nr:glycosyltransferase [Streptomyces avicenniae]